MKYLNTIFSYSKHIVLLKALLLLTIKFKTSQKRNALLFKARETEEFLPPLKKVTCAKVNGKYMQKPGNWNRTSQDKKQCQKGKMIFSSILACHIDNRWRNTAKDKNPESLEDLYWRLECLLTKLLTERCLYVHSQGIMLTQQCFFYLKFTRWNFFCPWVFHMSIARRKLIISQLKTKPHYCSVLHALIHHVIFISGHGTRAFP